MNGRSNFELLLEAKAARSAARILMLVEIPVHLELEERALVHPDREALYGEMPAFGAVLRCAVRVYFDDLCARCFRNRVLDLGRARCSL